MATCQVFSVCDFYLEPQTFKASVKEPHPWTYENIKNINNLDSWMNIILIIPCLYLKVTMSSPKESIMMQNMKYQFMLFLCVC